MCEHFYAPYIYITHAQLLHNNCSSGINPKNIASKFGYRGLSSQLCGKYNTGMYDPLLLLFLLVDFVVKRLQSVSPALWGSSRKGVDDEVRDPALGIVLEHQGHSGRVRVVLLRPNYHSR